MCFLLNGVGIHYHAAPPLDNGLDDLHARIPHQIQQTDGVAAYRMIVHRLLLRQPLKTCQVTLHDSEAYSADSRTLSQLSNETR